MLAPAPASERRTGSVQSLRFDDMEAMAATLIGSDVEFVPLQPGQFHGQSCRIDFEDFHLKRAIHEPLLMHGAIRPDYVALNMHVRPTGALTLNGESLGASMLSVLPEGTAVQVVCPGKQDRIGVRFRAEPFHRMIESYGIRAFPRGLHQILHLREDQASTIVHGFTAMTNFAENLPNLFTVPGLDKALTEECYRLLAGVLSSEEDHRRRPRQTKDMLRQVSAADEFLRAHIERPIYTEEICFALGISARVLYRSFGAVYGMSPHSYLKRRRLELARRALRLPRDSPALVKSVALSHGFWHLGHFSQEYATMFGEMPSETLGKSGPPH